MDSLLNDKNFKKELLESYLGPWRDRFTYSLGWSNWCLKSKKNYSSAYAQFKFKRYCIELIKGQRSVSIVLSEEWGEHEDNLEFLDSIYCRVISIDLADPCGPDILQDVLTNQFENINENI